MKTLGGVFLFNGLLRKVEWPNSSLGLLLKRGQYWLFKTHLHSQSVRVEMQVDLTIDFLALSQQGR